MDGHKGQWCKGHEVQFYEGHEGHLLPGSAMMRNGVWDMKGSCVRTMKGSGVSGR